MTSDDLTADQLDRLGETLTRDLRFLTKLCRRMELLGFPGDDPLYRAAIRAEGEMKAIRMAAHYASCKGGVGRERKSGD